MFACAVYSVTQQALSHGWSVIPLRGGIKLTTGKRPALKSWSPYQTALPTSAELRQWFEVEGYTAYGVVCSQISEIIVCDIDQRAALEILEIHYPHLLDTYTVQSGSRELPHLYWRVKFPVKTQKLHGADLKGEGSYVVGAGSEIAGHRWTVVNDAPVREITPEELALVCTLLAPEKKQTSPLTPEHPTCYLGKQDIQAVYEQQVQVFGQRNNSLFQTACLARDAGHSASWTVDTLAGLHAEMPAQDEHPPESYPARYREAERTIASAFNQPPRPFYTTYVDEPASRLPNPLREELLKRSDGPALLRTLEGLIIQGFKAGDCFCEGQVIQILQGDIGQHSIRRALQAQIQVDAENDVVEPFFRNCPTNKNAVFCYESSANASESAGGGLEGESAPHRRKIWYQFPSIEALCNLLEVEFRPGDPILLEDLKTRKTYREALEREFIKRRPAKYTQKWLSERLAVCDRTIRRYHDDISIHSCKMYDERPIYPFNVNSLPPDDELMGGYTLIDETGKIYPAVQSIAKKLWREGHDLSLRIQQGNLYWYGEWKPEVERRIETDYVKETIAPLVEDWSIPDENEISDALADTSLNLPEETIFVRHVANDGYTPPQTLEETVKLKSVRFYRTPLPNDFQESLAQRLYKAIHEMSIFNARRLVDLYGVTVVNATLSRTLALMWKGQITNPAGFMITAIQTTWRERYGWGIPKPEFKTQPLRRKRQKPYDLMKDPLTKSEKWLRWRIWFAFDMGDQESVARWQGRLCELNLPEEKVWDWCDPVGAEIPF